MTLWLGDPVDARVPPCCGSCAATRRSTRIGSQTRPATPSTAWRRQALDRPYIREAGKLRPATERALDAVAAKLKATAPDRIGVIAGALQDAESMKAAA